MSVNGDELLAVRATRSRVPKASDVLADRLRARILGDAMSPGDSLPSEAEIIADYGFSRGTVRETLRLLESDGLVTITRGPKGGIRVRYPDLSQISRSMALFLSITETPMRQFIEFRQLLEPAAAAAAARTATAEQRRWLLGVAEENLEVGFDRSIEFHEVVGVCSNNGMMRVAIAALDQEIAWHLPHERLTEEDANETRSAHLAVAQAIATGDEHRARQTMARHLEKFEKVLEAQGRLDEAIVPRSRWLSRA
ncbi:FadR/GntR family transcriptional regulator [soil metagenome]